MTRMLASVSTLQEAEIALAGGADIIDLRAGVNPQVIRDIVAAIGGRRLVSASTGDQPMAADRLVAAVREIVATQVDYVNVPLFPGCDAPACIARLATLASQVKIIAVFFAGAPPDLAVIHLLRRSGFTGVMIDTEGKTTRRLLDHLDMPTLLGFAEGCHAAGLLAGLAGSLELPDIPRLLVLAPDLLGFRAALYGPGKPASEIDLARVRAVRGLIPQEHLIADMHDVDYRFLAARGNAAVGEGVPVDLVFVEDLVLPVFIGAYARERDTPQNVRFAVTASVIRTGRTAEDMRDVFSYDLITDGIRMLIGSGHVALVETLAERIATMVLGHPRVTKVVVRVQKLQTGSGTVGVEIERTQKAARIIDDRPVVPLLAEPPKSASGTKP